jgi:predicted site-specific integrase-resolvase
MSTTPIYIPTREAARRLAITVGTLARWARIGRGPRAFRFGRGFRYLTTDIERWAGAQAVPGTGLDDDPGVGR